MITRRWDHVLCKSILILAFMAIIAGCAGLKGQSAPDPVPEIHPGILAGYLDSETLPDSLALLPPPPWPGCMRTRCLLPNWMPPKRNAKRVLPAA